MINPTSGPGGLDLQGNYPLGAFPPSVGLWIPFPIGFARTPSYFSFFGFPHSRGPHRMP